jgi:Protein of unknown function (DUF3710)
LSTVIFSRRRGSGRHSADRRTRDRYGTDPEFDDEATDDVEIPEYGPYDVSLAPDDVERLDRGSLKIPAVPGVEVRLQADPEGQVQQVQLVNDESALQLGVFAAPRTEGIWDEVRADIRGQLFTDGVAVEEADGEYGTELHARVRTPDGLTDLRFIGIDGPRWMVRAVYQGAAAADPAAAGPLADCLHGVVVERGSEAMPVREPLPLRLPRDLAERAGATPTNDGAAAPSAATGAAAFTPVINTAAVSAKANPAKASAASAKANPAKASAASAEAIPAKATDASEQRRARPTPRSGRKPSPRPRRAH